MMYNEGRKERFIAEYTTSEHSGRYIRVIFNKFSKYEEQEWHEDLCMASAEVIEPIINSQTGTRSESAERVLIVLRDYVKWCRRNRIKTSDGIFNVKVDVVEAVKEQMIKNPASLQERLDRVFADESKQTVDCLYRAYIWMAYAGLTDEEALDVDISEVDLDNLVIRHNKQIYQLYEEAKETFRLACTLKEFKYIHPNQSSSKYETTKPRYKSDKLMAGHKSVLKIATMRGIMNKRVLSPLDPKIKNDNNYVPVKLSYKKIYYSGIFFRAYQNEVRGLGSCLRDYAIEEVAKKQKQYKLSKNRTLNKIVNEMERELERDYDRWKCAFAV